MRAEPISLLYEKGRVAIGMCVMILLSRVIPQIMAIKPVWRAINGAVPLAAEGHHFALELIEAVTM